MAMTLSTKQFAALAFASMGGAMAGLAAGAGAKSCFPETTAGGRVLAGIVIGALIGTVSALVPAMIIYGGADSEGTTAGMGRPQLKAFRYPR
jgi:hypothetical protein